MLQLLAQRNKVTKVILALAFFFLIGGSSAHAQTPGTIDPVYKYAWSTLGGWINFAPTNGNVTVSTTTITGYVWSANDGWINLSPSNGGVLNNANGQLSGFAWDPANGWINFQGVTIDSNGVFHGQATGVSASGNYNIINFNCTNCRVITTWTPFISNGSSTTTTSTSTNTNNSGTTTVYQYVYENNNVLRGVSGSSIISKLLAPFFPQQSSTTSISIEPPPSEAVPGAYPSSSGNSGPQGSNGNTSGSAAAHATSGIAGVLSNILPSWLLPHAATTTSPGHVPPPVATTTTPPSTQNLPVVPIVIGVGGLVIIGIIVACIWLFL